MTGLRVAFHAEQRRSPAARERRDDRRQVGTVEDLVRVPADVPVGQLTSRAFADSLAVVFGVLEVAEPGRRREFGGGAGRRCRFRREPPAVEGSSPRRRRVLSRPGVGGRRAAGGHRRRAAGRGMTPGRSRRRRSSRFAPSDVTRLPSASTGTDLAGRPGVMASCGRGSFELDHLTGYRQACHPEHRGRRRHAGGTQTRCQDTIVPKE